MDPTLHTIFGPWDQWGIVGSVVVTLAIVCWRLWGALDAKHAAHIADIKVYADKYAEICVENSKTQTALANAIDRVSDKIK